MQVFDKLRPVALFALRLGLGAIFFIHGYDKLFTSTAAALKAFPLLGFPSYFVYISGALEMFGAILLLLGLFTRVAALLLALEMVVVLIKVSVPQGGIYAVRNYELPLSLCVAAFALVAVGAGLLSIDAATFERGVKARARG
jgi:putative oxidoreductase